MKLGLDEPCNNEHLLKYIFFTKYKIITFNVQLKIRVTIEQGPLKNRKTSLKQGKRHTSHRKIEEKKFLKQKISSDSQHPKCLFTCTERCVFIQWKRDYY